MLDIVADTGRDYSDSETKNDGAQRIEPHERKRDCCERGHDEVTGNNERSRSTAHSHILTAVPWGREGNLGGRAE